MMCHTFRRAGPVTAGLTIALSTVAVVIGPTSAADPAADRELIVALPMIVPTPSNWQPQFPFPYDKIRDRVTAADINAERELCQWHEAQYLTLSRQIDRVQFNRIQPNGVDWDYTIDGVGEQVDIVVGNIDQSLAFMTPRVLALTQDRNSFGDVFFPIFKGEAFFKLWEQLSNVSNGIKAHQPDWFTGPSVQKAKRWGLDIYRAHICDQGTA